MKACAKVLAPHAQLFMVKVNRLALRRVHFCTFQCTIIVYLRNGNIFGKIWPVLMFMHFLFGLFSSYAKSQLLVFFCTGEFKLNGYFLEMHEK